MSAAGERWALTGATVLFFALMITHPAETAAAVSDGMTLFMGKLVPVLFPYMVLSHFFVSYGLLDPLNALLPVGKLFGMPSCSFSIFAMGHLCGYPVGAKMTAESVRTGRLTPEQGALLCGAASGASPAFLLHAAGGMFWGDTRFGGVLWLTQVLFGLMIGRLFGRRYGKVDASAMPAPDLISPARCFCEAVSGSALQLVSVGGYIVFFILLAAILPLGESGCALLEFSSGVQRAAGLGGFYGLFLTGLAVGTGGLSVLAQTAYMVSGTGISLRPYLLCRAGGGLVSGAAAVLYGFLVPEIRTAAPARPGMLLDSGKDQVILFLWLLGMMWYTAGMRRQAER